MTPAERAHAIAEREAAKMDPKHEWWTVKKPSGAVFEVMTRPPYTVSEMIALYPGSVVLPR